MTPDHTLHEVPLGAIPEPCLMKLHQALHQTPLEAIPGPREAALHVAPSFFWSNTRVLPCNAAPDVAPGTSRSNTRALPQDVSADVGPGTSRSNQLHLPCDTALDVAPGTSRNNSKASPHDTVPGVASLVETSPSSLAGTICIRKTGGFKTVHQWKDIRYARLSTGLCVYPDLYLIPMDGLQSIPRDPKNRCLACMCESPEFLFFAV